MDTLKGLLGNETQKEEPSMWDEINNQCSLTIQQVLTYYSFITINIYLVPYLYKFLFYYCTREPLDSVFHLELVYFYHFWYVRG
jgi:hypothetical protein